MVLEQDWLPVRPLDKVHIAFLACCRSKPLGRLTPTVQSITSQGVRRESPSNALLVRAPAGKGVSEGGRPRYSGDEGSGLFR